MAPVISLASVSRSVPLPDGQVLRILTGVDLHVEAGEHVAVVGRSGSGKSTLVDLVLGLHEPTGGRLLVGGRPLGEVLHAWRRRVGYVPQDVALLDADVARNVALSWRDEDVDLERVRQVLEAAQLTDVVAGLPEGVRSQVGERGLRLSGGQRQRLGIARALYSDPSVLVLDEATSALDTATEAAVSRTVAALRGVTVLVVAHRLATVRDCDAVVVLDAGRVAQVGTPAEVSQRPRTEHVARLVGLNVVRHDADLLSFTPDAVAVSLEEPVGSPRLRWRGTVAAVSPHGDAVRVLVSAEPDLIADVTPDAATELGLVPGRPVWLSVKSTSVRRYPARPDGDPGGSAGGVSMRP